MENELKLITEENDVNNILKKVLLEVDNPTEKLPILKEMVKIMKEHKGAGLTANQVGLEDKMFVMLKDGKVEFVINPVILNYGTKTKNSLEGCLSYPNKTKIVTRSKKITVKYHNGKKMVFGILEGKSATIFQHEYDHCLGKCPLGEI